jgi:hypothetical protein
LLKLPINKTLTIMILLALMIGGLLAAAPLWGPFLLSEEVAFGTAPMIGVAIAGPAFAALCLLVRCQRCQYRLFWYAVTKRSHSDSIEWFLTARQCPECGYSTP